MLSKLLNLSSSLRLASLSLLGASMLLIAGCSPLDVASTLLGGGPNVNAQIGKENVQGVNVRTEAPSVSIRPRARVDNIDQSSGNKVENADTVNNIQGVPLEWWIITVLVAIVALLIDSPQTIIRNLWNRKQ